jgi:copper chaperone CopZ
MKTYVFKVKGMSCGHCEHAVETSVKKVSGVKEVKASASKGMATVLGSESVSVPAVIAAIQDAGFEGEKSDDEDGHSSWSKTKFAVFSAAAAVLVFAVSAAGGLSFFPTVNPTASLGIIFLTGLLTSLHCTAMCGGINLSQCMSKDGACAKKFSGLVPSSLYNGGRVISYTATGAVTGALGSVFDFSPVVKSAIMIGAGVFMLLMGLSFLGVLNPDIISSMGAGHAM